MTRLLSCSHSSPEIIFFSLLSQQALTRCGPHPHKPRSHTVLDALLRLIALNFSTDIPRHQLRIFAKPSGFSTKIRSFPQLAPSMRAIGLYSACAIELGFRVSRSSSDGTAITENKLLRVLIVCRF